MKNNTPQVLRFCLEYRTRKAIQQHLNRKDREYFRLRILKPLLDEKLLEMRYPQAPNSPKQMYKTSEKGKEFLEQGKE